MDSQNKIITPRLSRSYSAVQQQQTVTSGQQPDTGGQQSDTSGQQVSTHKEVIPVDPYTYSLYIAKKILAGFTDDSHFIAHLLERFSVGRQEVLSDPPETSTVTGDSDCLESRKNKDSNSPVIVTNGEASELEHHLQQKYLKSEPYQHLEQRPGHSKERYQVRQPYQTSEVHQPPEAYQTTAAHQSKQPDKAGETPQSIVQFHTREPSQASEPHQPSEPHQDRLEPPQASESASNIEVESLQSHGDHQKQANMEDVQTAGSTSKELKPAPPEHVCYRCGEDLKTAVDLESHLKTCGDVLAKYRQPERAKPTSYIICQFCGMRCVDSAHYKKHYSQYHVNHSLLYCCKHCNRKQAFTDKKKLKAHQQMDVVCGYCGKEYSNQQHLNLHVTNMNHDKGRKQERAQKKVAKKPKVLVPDVMEAVLKSEQPKLPSGFSFMSVNINSMRAKTPDIEGRYVYVPETAYRHGYVLQTAFTATPFP